MTAFGCLQNHVNDDIWALSGTAHSGGLLPDRFRSTIRKELMFATVSRSRASYSCCVASVGPIVVALQDVTANVSTTPKRIIVSSNRTLTPSIVIEAQR